MKKYFNFFALMCTISVMSLISCNSHVTPNPQPAPPFVSRLIFTGEADVGGSTKVEIKDSYIESVLDGNPDWQGNILNPVSPLPSYASPVKITISNLVYYDQIIDTITCNDDVKNKMLLQYKGPFGTYFVGPDGKLYRTIGVLQYIEQGLTEDITNASVNAFFLVTCQDSNGNSYEVSFY
ncbi:MAG: hypothetical protein NTY22_04260, partial [Proteobacteria bacterium]|nr:hypothetical protein [Pseudomonadota bacterium]